MVINPVSYCLLNRGHWERHPICQERPAQSLAAGCVLFLSCLLLCSFPSKPHPHPHSYPSPSCPRFSPLLLAFSTLPTFVSTSARGGVCQGRTELLDEAGPPIQSGSFPSRRRQLPTPDLALSTISPWRGLLGHRADFANPLAALFCPASFSRSHAWYEGRVQLGFFFSNLSGRFLLSISASTEPGLHGPPPRRGIFSFPQPLCSLPLGHLREVGVGDPNTKSDLQ